MAGAGQWPQRTQQRCVGQLGLPLLHAFAAEHECVLIGEPLLELPHQPGLADARLSAEQHERRSAGDGVIECRLHSGLLSNEFM